MFRPVPDADYVYCRQGWGLPLASTAFVRYCQGVWRIVYTAKTWGEFVDRLGEFDSGLLEYAFDLDDLFDPRWGGRERDEPLGGPSAVEDCGLPMAGGEREPYVSWDSDMPDPIVDLADSGETMVSTYCTLAFDKLPAALDIIHERGETAVEDCDLLWEVVSMGDDWPLPPNPGQLGYSA